MGPLTMSLEEKKPRTVAEQGEWGFLIDALWTTDIVFGLQRVGKILVETTPDDGIANVWYSFQVPKVARKDIYSFLLSATTVQEGFHASLQNSHVSWNDSQSMLESTNAEASIWLFFILVFQSEVLAPPHSWTHLTNIKVSMSNSKVML